MEIKVFIAGGGLAGLACARGLHAGGRPYLLVEREKEFGGFCRSVQRDGYTFDYTGHFLHLKNPRIVQWIRSLAPGVFKPRRRHACIYSQGVTTEYPYQENNAGLPSKTALQNVSGYLEACLRRREGGSRRNAPDHFKNWCLTTFGQGISRNFMFPYNGKLWKAPLESLTTQWMGRFVPQPNPLRVVEGALASRKSDTGYNAEFLYPDRGGIEVLPEVMARGLPGLFRGVSLSRVDFSRHEALLSTGFTVRYERMVSSVPLPTLIRMAWGVPARLRKAAGLLRARSIFNVNFGLRVRQPIPFSWVYFPEPEFDFHRAGSVSACVPGMAPRGRSTVYLEFSYRGIRPDKPRLGRRAIASLVKLGWIRSPRDIETRVDLDLPGAYVIYDRWREEIVGELTTWLERQGVAVVGRYGRWEYGTMESALEQGWGAAKI